MVLLAVCLFSFYSYGAPRDLHSFPTRRSSDLRRCAGADRRVERRRIGGQDGKLVANDLVQRRTRPDAGLLVLQRDRKSTRLNSSHSQISYAVFCLKKKKEITMNLNVWHSCVHS